jgi:hypothetical protein
MQLDLARRGEEWRETYHVDRLRGRRDDVRVPASVGLVHQRVHGVPSKNGDGDVRHEPERERVILLRELLALGEDLLVFERKAVRQERAFGRNEPDVNNLGDFPRLDKLLQSESRVGQASDMEQRPRRTE